MIGKTLTLRQFLQCRSHTCEAGKIGVCLRLACLIGFDSHFHFNSEKAQLFRWAQRIDA
jgi:hypothetical protein